MLEMFFNALQSKNINPELHNNVSPIGFSNTENRQDKKLVAYFKNYCSLKRESLIPRILSGWKANMQVSNNNTF